MIEVRCDAARRFTFDPRRTAMLVIDLQRDFLDPEGFCGQAGDDLSPVRAVLPRVEALLPRLRKAGVRLIHTREGYAADGSDIHAMKRERGSVGSSGPLGRFLIRGESGHDFVEEMRPAPGETVIDKPGFGAFYRTELEEILRDGGISHLIIAGVTTQCCVFSTLREAVDRGFWCLTLEDCCAAFDRSLHDGVFAMIQGENHLFGWIARSDDLINAL